MDALGSNPEPAECFLCARMIPAGLAVVLRRCQHSFCFTCLKNALQIADTSELQCPYPYAEFTCGRALDSIEVEYILSYEEICEWDQPQQSAAENCREPNGSSSNRANDVPTGNTRETVVPTSSSKAEPIRSVARSSTVSLDESMNRILRISDRPTASQSSTGDRTGQTSDSEELPTRKITNELLKELEVQRRSRKSGPK